MDGRRQSRCNRLVLRSVLDGAMHARRAPRGAVKLDPSAAGDSSLVTLRVPTAVVARLDALRPALGANRGAVVRALVAEALAARAAPLEAPEALLAAVRRLAARDGAHGLAWVPDLAREVPALSARAIRDGLLALDRRELVELRPHSGADALPSALRELCPQGIDGWPLAYVKVR